MFNLKDLPLALLNLVTMPIHWMKKGFSNLSVNHQAKVMWDTLHQVGHKLEEVQTTNPRLEKELTAWNVFGPYAQRTIEEFAMYKSDRNYEKDYPYSFPETDEEKKKQHDPAINAAMRQQSRLLLCHSRKHFWHNFSRGIRIEGCSPRTQQGLA